MVLYLSLSIDRQKTSARLESIGWFALHTTLALMVSPFIALMLTVAAHAVFKDGVPRRLLDLGGFANPFIWGPGFALGFLFNRIKSKRSACWVWPVGMAWLANGIWDSVRYYDPRWYQGCTASENVVNAFFVLNSSRCGGGESGLAGLFFTFPAVTSLAYSLGAWAGIVSRRRWDRADTKQDTTTLGLSQPKP
jgi:hypothetical protein